MVLGDLIFSNVQDYFAIVESAEIFPEAVFITLWPSKHLNKKLLSDIGRSLVAFEATSLSAGTSEPWHNKGF